MTDLYKIIYLSVRLSVYISIYISSNHQSEYLSYVHLATNLIVSLCLPTMLPIAVEMVRMRARLVLQIHTAAMTDAADKVDGCFASVHQPFLTLTHACIASTRPRGGRLHQLWFSELCFRVRYAIILFASRKNPLIIYVGDQPLPFKQRPTISSGGCAPFVSQVWWGYVDIHIATFDEGFMLDPIFCRPCSLCPTEFILTRLPQ